MYAQVRKHEQALRRRLHRFLYPSTDEPREGAVTPPTRSESDSTIAAGGGEVLLIDELEGSENHSILDSQIFERSVQERPDVKSRSQSFSSISSIPAHLPQEAYVPSVLDATAAIADDASSVEIICGHSGHPLCRRRTASINGLSFMALREQEHEEEEQEQEQGGDTASEKDIDYSDRTRLNFTSFADMLSDEEGEQLHLTSPSITRKSSVVVVPLSAKSTALSQ